MSEIKKQSKSAETTVPKQRGRPFPKGVSGNPAGRPLGSKNFSTDFDEVVEEIAKVNSISQSDARKILLKKAYFEAKEGNFNFYKDIIDRYYGKAIERHELTGLDGQPLFSPQEKELAEKALENI